MNVDPKVAKEWMDAGIISQSDYEALIKGPKKSKYNARKTEVDGIVFHSSGEAQRYSQLKALEMSGEIKNLKLQPRFPMIIDGVKICTYVADFQYLDSVGNIVVEDFKGYKTDVYQIKKKLLLAIYKIKVLET